MFKVFLVFHCHQYVLYVLTSIPLVTVYVRNSQWGMILSLQGNVAMFGDILVVTNVMWEGCYYNLVDISQGCSASYNTQDSKPQQIFPSKMAIVVRVRNPNIHHSSCSCLLPQHPLLQRPSVRMISCLCCSPPLISSLHKLQGKPHGIRISASLFFIRDLLHLIWKWVIDCLSI